MPKAPRKVQITIGLLAVLVIAYGLSIMHLDENSTGRRTAMPGQLIVVRLHVTWNWMTSTDESVVAPISVMLKPIATGYFLALKPGRATLQAFVDPCPANMPAPRCMAAGRMWRVEVTVGPSG